MTNNNEFCEEFKNKYKNVLFKQPVNYTALNHNEAVKSCTINRQCLFMNLQRSYVANDNKTSTFLLKDGLKENAKLVDDRTTVNNFANFLSKCQTNKAKSWEKTDHVYSPKELLEPLPKACNDKCSSFEPDQNFIQSFCSVTSEINQGENVKTKQTLITSTYKKKSLTQLDRDFSHNSGTKELKNFRNKRSHYSQDDEYHNQRQKKKSTDKNDETGNVQSVSFKTANEELRSQMNFNGTVKKSLGGKGNNRTASDKFILPVMNDNKNNLPFTSQPNQITSDDERLKNIDPKMIELIRNEIIDSGSKVTWKDIAGLDFAKNIIQEIVVWPMLRPDIFTGLRRPPKGILLFGPPGTGKTMIGKCIASQSNSTFFCISASSLTSKWIGDGEKMVRALFTVSRCHQPAVIFIDEIDSLLSQRNDMEHESSRRLKTEFLVQLDGAATGDEDRILIIGATNRPQELDEAARRRLTKRLYIPLPEYQARKQLLQNLMDSERNTLTDREKEEIAQLTEGYSGADMKSLCQEAVLGPIRSISFNEMIDISANEVRPVNIEDFKLSLKRIRPSVSQKDLDSYLQWNSLYGMAA